MSGLFLIDAIGPFFRNYQKKRTNWSKIVFTHLDPADEDQWKWIKKESSHLAHAVSQLGYTAVTLDDLAHLVDHPWLELHLRARNTALRERFKSIFQIHKKAGLDLYLTSDVLPITAGLKKRLGSDHNALNAYYTDLVDRCFDQMPELSGLVLRIGESDGLDVKDPIRTSLHLKTAAETKQFLQGLLPLFEKRKKTLIFRTWTVGAHHIGDLIWHRQRLTQVFEGLESDFLIVSMKHGESDFFRYLSINKAFFQLPQKKIIELQARREYEGAGEYPSYIGWDCQRYAAELATAENMAGISVWCQTGGWHAFSRRTFVDPESDEDIWVRLNCAAAIDVFRHRKTPEASIATHCWDEEAAAATTEILHLSEIIIRDLFYIPEFARQKLFFRRVRIPPLLHIYWDCLFITAPVRKLIRHFVKDHNEALSRGEAALEHFPRMIELSKRTGLPTDDIAFMRDTFTLIAMARRYYFLASSPELITEIRAAKNQYKANWPRSARNRYRIKTDFQPFRLKRRTLSWLTSLALRKKRGYRLVDHIFTLNLLSLVYRAFNSRYQKALPKFIRKSAMGVDTLFK